MSDPVNTVPPSIYGTPEVGQSIGVNPGLWTPTPGDYTYQWQHDSAGDGSYTDISSATDMTYTIPSADLGNDLRCQVTAYAATPPPPPPPPVGLLKWKPPGYVGGDPRDPANYPGFTVIPYPAWGTFATLDDTKDYFVTGMNLIGVGSKTGGVFTVGGFIGGRHIVIVGGYSDATNSNNRDDTDVIQFQSGDPSGIIHIEGVHFARSVNAITMRTGRTLQVEYCRFSNNASFQGDHSYVHPDVIQCWVNLGSGGGPKLRVDQLTAISDDQVLSVLQSPDPVSWECHHCNTQSKGVGIIPSSGGQPHNITQWTTDDCWYTPLPLGAAGLDDRWGYFDFNTYEVRNASGGLIYASTPNQVGGRGYGRAQGDTWRCLEVGSGLYNQFVTYGDPPGGDFVPASGVGTGYVPVGYM
jgi:hypothetical protein